MRTLQYKRHFAQTAGVVALLTALGAYASDFNIPSGDLEAALNAYSAQSGVQLMVSSDAVKGVQSHGAKGDLTPTAALSRILAGTGFVPSRDTGGGLTIVKAVNQSMLVTDDRLELEGHTGHTGHTS